MNFLFLDCNIFTTKTFLSMERGDVYKNYNSKWRNTRSMSECAFKYLCWEYTGVTIDYGQLNQLRFAGEQTNLVN